MCRQAAPTACQNDTSNRFMGFSPGEPFGIHDDRIIKTFHIGAQVPNGLQVGFGFRTSNVKEKIQKVGYVDQPWPSKNQVSDPHLEI